MNYAKHVSRKVTPQNEKIPGSNQVQNSAGGYSYPVTDEIRLERFLILGNSGGSYYASEKKLTKENADAVIRCIKNNGKETVAKIVEISDSGRAPKNDPAIFALALATAYGNEETKREAFAAVNRVCRTGTHILQFAAACNELRGWGRALKRAIGEWYMEKSVDQLAYQVAKYQQRDGWSHRDLLRLSHPTTKNSELQTVLRWVTHGMELGNMKVDRKGVVKEYGSVTKLPRLLEGFELAKSVANNVNSTAKDIVKLIEEYNLPRECVPTRFLKEKEIWEALLYAGKGMPITALIRNLGNLSKCGLLSPLSKTATHIAERITDVNVLKKGRVHPLAILTATTTYGAGRGFKGTGNWIPVPQVTDALDKAFYLAFAAVQPTNKRYLISLDVSGSMSSPMSGSFLQCRQAAAAMALVIANTEPNYYVMGFSTQFTPLAISKGQKLQDALRITYGLPFSGTDCAVPWVWAKKNKIEVDVNITITDSETWYGSIHPSQALKQYRDEMGMPAKSVVMGMVSNGFTIADPEDAGSMDVVGFDTNVPDIIANFVGRDQVFDVDSADDIPYGEEID